MKNIYRKPETECLFLNTRYNVMASESAGKGSMDDGWDAPARSNARKLYV